MEGVFAPDVHCEMGLLRCPVLTVRAREWFFARVDTEVTIRPVLALVALEPPCLPRGRDDLPLLRVLAADVIGEMALPLRPVIAVGARKGVLVRGPLPLGHDDDVTTTKPRSGTEYEVTRDSCTIKIALFSKYKLSNELLFWVARLDHEN